MDSRKLKILNPERKDEERTSQTSSSGTSAGDGSTLEVKTTQDSDVVANTVAGVEKIGLQQGKILFGAQIRKLRRQRKMEAGTWSEQRLCHYDSKSRGR